MTAVLKLPGGSVGNPAAFHLQVYGFKTIHVFALALFAMRL